MSRISVDFDGTLHPYTNGWCGYEPADEPPTKGAREFLEEATAAGYTIIVCSARCDHEDGTAGIVRWLDRWDLLQFVAEVTSTKPAAVAYIDDRSVVFRGSWTDVLTDVEELAKKRG